MIFYVPDADSVRTGQLGLVSSNARSRADGGN